jgi:enoyl-CoA hydratase
MGFPVHGYWHLDGREEVAMDDGLELHVEMPARGPDGRPVERVALVTIDRPRALNALSFSLLDGLAGALEHLDHDPGVGSVVLTGAGERAFAAGVDIRELKDQTPETLREGGAFAAWDRIDRVGLPIVAAVRGFALGGGCELAMACDIVVAAEDAVFAQPEIALGVIPGGGGTQRLTRAIGKARAMDLILTGRRIDANEAERLGIVSRVVASERVVPEALEVAARIAAGPAVAVRAAKRAVLAAAELPLSAGLTDERRAFFELFATEDQAEGMAAFVEKRPPRWTGR